MAAPLFVVAVFLVACATSTYTLTDNYYGTTFFNNFAFFTASDPTHGYVNFVNQATAQSQGLISATSNTAAVYMGADHTNVASGSGRNSVRIVSNKAFNGGLFIIDLLHMPTGCGTWPAFWMTASDVTWPQHGEIDIIEGVNTNTINAATLHTTPGCTMSSVPTSSFSGHWSTNNVGGASNNCDVNAANQASNAGCGVQSGQSNSYGAPFNSINGGVYATEWINSATGGIKVWFFPRTAIPSDITSGNPNPSGWGNPMANFQFGSNCPNSHFANQQIIFDLTFCGDWAGNVFGSSGCSGSCNTYVQNNPSAFTEAYWLINSVKAYSGSSSPAPAPSPSPSPSPAPAGSCTTVANGDYYGNDIANVPASSAAACCSACQAYTGSVPCKAWSWTSNTCYMKSAAGTLQTASGVTTGTTSGSGSTKTCTTSANSDFATGGDFANAATSTAAACCTLCTQTSGCAAWAWNGVCYMKNSGHGAMISKSGVTAGVVSSSFLETAAGSTGAEQPTERLIKRVMKEDLFRSANLTTSRDSLNVLRP